MAAFKVANEHPPAHPRSSSQRKKMSSEQVNLLNVNQAKTVPMVSIREIACYLSMLEGGKVEDKLECKLCMEVKSITILQFWVTPHELYVFYIMRCQECAIQEFR